MARKENGKGACRGLGSELARALSEHKRALRACTAGGPHVVFASCPGTAPELPAPVELLAGDTGRRWDWMRGSNWFLIQERLIQVGP